VNVKMKVVAASDPGNNRVCNEDSYVIDVEKNLVVVGDGMGGHNAGRHASQVAVAMFQQCFNDLDADLIKQITQDVYEKKMFPVMRLIACIRLAHRKVYNESLANRDFHGMGTTLTAVAVSNGSALIGHVGDGRVYRFRRGKMEQLTDDHTYVNELIVDKDIMPQDVKKFQDRNVITRALGVDLGVKIDIRSEPLQAGDLLLICTDGLTHALTEAEIDRIVKYNRNNFDHAIKHLIDDANMKDGSDNITVALIHVQQLAHSLSGLPFYKQTIKFQGESIVAVENKILKRMIKSEPFYQKLRCNFLNLFNKSGKN